jgi:5-hydroxyisourate hydrolase-like protein (transthyretin family)
MRLGLALSPVIAVVLALGLAAPVGAADPAPTTLTMAGEPTHADEVTQLQLRLRHETDTPVVAGEVLVERRRSGTWRPIATVFTDTRGRASVDVTLVRRAADNVFRASYAGDLESASARTGPVPVDLVRRSSRVTVGGPDSVVDEQSVAVSVRWRTGNGLPVNGTVRLQRRKGGHWRLVRKLRTGSDGRAQITIRPRTDTMWRAQVRRLDWVFGDTSNRHRINNLPPGIPVQLPSAAPKPRINLPDQPHAVGAGPNAHISPVPARVWNQMTGRTWHQGCPVGRSSLRYLRINYWDYRGYRRRGELVAHASAIGKMAGALAEMYRKKLPIRAMYRVDRFGWSSRVHGGDDYRSMAAGNTSAFNCRDVVGKPGVRSPHSYGRSLDLNTWENPYRSRQGTVPNTWWMGHSHPRVAWRSRSHAVVRVMARHGLRWTYGNGDTQHFDAYGSSGRLAARYADASGPALD